MNALAITSLIFEVLGAFVLVMHRFYFFKHSLINFLKSNFSNQNHLEEILNYWEEIKIFFFICKSFHRSRYNINNNEQIIHEIIYRINAE